MLAERFGLDWQSLDDRELVADAIHVKGRNIPEEEWKPALAARPETVRKIIADPLVGAIAPVFDRLSKARNNINHGGFLEPKDATGLQRTLEECFSDVERVLRGNVAEVAPEGLKE